MELPDVETEEVAKVFRSYGLSGTQMQPIVTAITSDQSRWVDFMMRFELGLEAPDPARAGRSAGTIAASYIVGGLVPLAPYILMKHVLSALWVSIGVTLLALFAFGAKCGAFGASGSVRVAWPRPAELAANPSSERSVPSASDPIPNANTKPAAIASHRTR